MMTLMGLAPPARSAKRRLVLLSSIRMGWSR